MIAAWRRGNDPSGTRVTAGHNGGAAVVVGSSAGDRVRAGWAQPLRLCLGSSFPTGELGRLHVHHGEPNRPRWVELEQCVVGVDDRAFAVLASDDLVVAPVGCDAVRHGRRDVSRHQSGAAHRQHAARLRALPPDDRSRGAQRLRRGDLRGPSASCGVGRVDRRAKRRVEHMLLAAHRAGLRRLCAAARMGAVSRHAGALSRWR